MTLISWNTSFETGVSEVDKQHHHLVKITNRFGDLLSREQATSADTDRLLQELLSYAEYHFAEEERLMRSAGIDSRHLRHHEQEHRNFFQDMAGLQREWVAEKAISGETLLEYLVNWLIYHVLGSDRNMARQLEAIQSGTSAADAYRDHEKKAFAFRLTPHQLH